MMQLSPLFLEKLQAAEERGEVKGQQELVLRQLNRRMGNNVSLEVEAKVKSLSLPQLEDLGEALLDFAQMVDLIGWLDAHWE
ncbi:DUF4351 domain-containing protein [Chamaesiphon sp. VAR_69_metabat_338]|uniref:DUF4351 domain-containing protein n=1 Tax=Chamaesiphon sp. VAR_69_metabat_338 TaxID=2964704 RepID=UPI00286D9CFF|nr:DUF4351 domain-containing protein [Chamaesiphon sp. VAR_69_metabat_338]